MNLLEPRQRHPLLWILTDVLGLSRREVRARTNISALTLERLDSGVTDGRRQCAQLHKLIDDTVQAIVESAEDHPGKDHFAPYRLACYEAIRVAKALHPANQADSHPPRETDLVREVLQKVGRGQWRQMVISDLRGIYSPRSVERAARRIGVRESRREGRRYWELPPDIVPHKLPPPRERVTAPKTSTQRRLRFALVDYLERHPDGTPPETVVAHMKLKGFRSRAMVYREARRSDVRRETTGFGPSKRTLWYPMHQPKRRDDDTP